MINIVKHKIQKLVTALRLAAYQLVSLHRPSPLNDQKSITNNVPSIINQHLLTRNDKKFQEMINYLNISIPNNGNYFYLNTPTERYLFGRAIVSSTFVGPFARMMQGAVYSFDPSDTMPAPFFDTQLLDKEKRRKFNAVNEIIIE